MANSKYHGMLKAISKLSSYVDPLSLSKIVYSRFPAYPDNGRSIRNKRFMLSAIKTKKRVGFVSKKNHARKKGEDSN